MPIFGLKQALMPFFGLNAAVCFEQNCLYVAECGGQVVRVIYTCCAPDRLRLARCLSVREARLKIGNAWLR